MPVYNSANQLNATFDSLVCQTMDASDFEIICVNDCSTDNSKEVIEQYAAKMPNIILIDLPKNTGSAMIPRNTAIEAASGRYIHFLDSDDFLGEEALERLYNAAEEYQSDVVFGRHVGVNGRPVPKSMFYKGNLPHASLLTDNLVYSLAPHKMVRRSFLKEHGIRFHPEAKAGNDDQLFVMQCYIKARVITLLDNYDYYFIVARGNENFTSRIFPAEQFFFVPLQIMKFTDEQVSDPVVNRKIKSLYINRFLKTERLGKHLFDPAFPAEKKQEWLLEGKRFLDTYLDNEMIRMADTVNLELIRVVQANDLQTVQRLAHQKAQASLAKKKNPKVILITARSTDLKTYIRPSAKALPASPISHHDKPFQVFISTKGWLEVRQPDKDGGTYAVFVQEKDVRFSLEFRMRRLFKRMKALLKRMLKRKKSAIA